jgi:hypothetical protein
MRGSSAQRARGSSRIGEEGVPNARGLPWAQRADARDRRKTAHLTRRRYLVLRTTWTELTDSRSR